jgi:hypothetical protein
MVVLWPLDHVPPYYLGISDVPRCLPVEIDLFEQLLLVIFEFSHHGGVGSSVYLREGRVQDLEWLLPRWCSRSGKSFPQAEEKVTRSAFQSGFLGWRCDSIWPGQRWWWSLGFRLVMLERSLGGAEIFVVDKGKFGPTHLR